MKYNVITIRAKSNAALFPEMGAIGRVATMYLTNAEMITLNDCMLRRGKHNPKALREFATRAATKWHKRRINREFKDIATMNVEYKGVIPQR